MPLITQLAGITSGTLYHPSYGGDIRYQITELPDDPDEQVAMTIALMSKYATEDSQTQDIKQDARMAVVSYPGLEPEQAVWRWIKSRVRFQDDEITGRPVHSRLLQLGNPNYPVVETLTRPRDLIAMNGTGGRVGDCDDYSMYGAALLLALGKPARFVTVAADPSQPDAYSHVYLATEDRDGNRFPLDISHGPYPGWEVQNRFGKRDEWTVGGSWLGLALAAAGIYLVYLLVKGEYLCK